MSEEQDKEKPVVHPSPPASKAERQAAWRAYCEKMGWDDAECNRRASIFPPGVTMRVLKWPEL